jgi:hypothetical protein
MADKFDIDFKLLPPDLQMKLWVLALDANTSKVAIAYQANGASLLPFPNELATTFNAAGTGLASMADDIGQAPNNPLAWYKLHSNDVGTITKAVNLGQQIDKLSDKSNRFGIGLRLNYAQATGLTIYGGAQLSF